jgi:3-methyladenine DNA glycosylase AlkC
MSVIIAVLGVVGGGRGAGPACRWQEERRARTLRGGREAGPTSTRLLTLARAATVAAVASALKDSVDVSVVEELARRFAAVDDSFDTSGFSTRTVPQLAGRELKARIDLIAGELWRALGDRDPAESLACLVDVARAEPPIDGWAAWPLAAVVELFGLSRPAEALDAMEHVTQRMSCEFAVRPFLRDHYDATYARLLAFTEHPDERVRRLPSEGTRPRLPWAMKVQRLLDDPLPGLALLHRLRHDPSETVRRSVANHLNDVSRAHPDLVVDTLSDWMDEPETDRRMVSHALRTLVKNGHAGALGVLGMTTDASVAVERFEVSPAVVVMDTHLVLMADVVSTAARTQRLVVDFVIHHVNASGATSPKVFKWANIDLEPGERCTLTKRRLIRQASTRTYRAGTHRVDLQVAGRILASTSFDILL